MMSFRSLLLLIASLALVSAFTSPKVTKVGKTASTRVTSLEPAFIFKKKEPEEDFSDIEVRDMTREEMKAYNEQTEKIMNAELWGMTFFSLILSLPMFYLVWVGFFSETAEMNIDM